MVTTDTQILVLGSLPGAASLSAGRYYAHPRNQFWRLIGNTFGLPLPDLIYEDRLAALLGQGVGLWDVVAEAERKGSLDAAIRNPAMNDLNRLIADLPALRTIGFNGAAAARIGTAELGSRANRYCLLRLPSSSPAHAIPYEHKLAQWRQLAA